MHRNYRSTASPIMSAEEFSRSRNFTPTRGRRFSLVGHEEEQDKFGLGRGGYGRFGDAYSRAGDGYSGVGNRDGEYGLRNREYDYAREGDLDIPSYLKSTDSKRISSWNCTPNRAGAYDRAKYSYPLVGANKYDGFSGDYHGARNAKTGTYSHEFRGFGDDGRVGDGYSGIDNYTGMRSGGFESRYDVGAKYGLSKMGEYERTSDLWNDAPRRDSFTEGRYDDFLGTRYQGRRGSHDSILGSRYEGPYMSRWENIDNGIVKGRTDTWSGSTKALDDSPLLKKFERGSSSPLVSTSNYTIDRIKNNMESCKAADYRSRLHSGPLSTPLFQNNYRDSNSDEYNLSKRIDNIKRIYDSSNLGRHTSPGPRYLDVDDVYERAKKQKQQLLSINRL
ncbi:hypothetical protein BEWA_003580 [Theileria equi strain WA]|uniref:Uncharacterized protein n=1 Tax=Theileria equi strain WA TaxID=1537102 RepID=L0AZG8_THEEQ|nr:hypothetical protein BEWA_003580 [Theileria equi strain WA]AFZ80950.1 hypothetical protein BEWA_003580 [Theileria equi strain WA]|eukprot:XP_004830616.1 hypothetical protein BEWA_003580 [Theileria equi strain WA]